jgi:ferredoxin
VEKVETFGKILGMPQEMVPYIDLVATEQEIDLVVGLGGRAMTLGQVAEMMRLGGAEAEDLLVSATRRAIVDRETKAGTTTYSASTFYRRLTYLSMQDYDGWREIPEEVREPLLAWHLDANIEHHDLERRLDRLRRDPDAVTIHNRDILLLDEALEMVDAAELHVVVPCDCRTTVIACDLPRWNTCLRLDDRGRRTLEQGEGEIVSKDQCRQIVIEADRAGLLHTGQRPEYGRQAILNGNCCACCSYPIRAGIELGMAKAWPRSHYVAVRDEARCTQCGTCVERCPFGAVEHDGTIIAFGDEERVDVRFDEVRCFGCGLCANTCPEDAITMVPLAIGA